MNDQRKQQYFAEMAPRYSSVTGNTTMDIFARFLGFDDLGITSESIVHDNAAGPGTATQVLMQRAATATGTAPTIIATDFAPGMIHALEQIKNSEIQHNQAWSKVTPLIVDSADLSQFEDGYFTHSISNFSLFTITESLKSLQETRRTLKTGGTAVILLWKVFAIQSMLATAQDLIKGDGYSVKNAVPLNGPRYLEEGVARTQLVEAGFAEDNVQDIMIEHLITPDQVSKLEGLRDFMATTSIASGSTRGWTEEEKKQWPKAVQQAMAREIESNGGVKFESWISIARK